MNACNGIEKQNIEELRLYLGQLVVLNRDLRTYMDGIDYSARRMFLCDG